jgi:hypothetical protein
MVCVRPLNEERDPRVKNSGFFDRMTHVELSSYFPVFRLSYHGGLVVTKHHFRILKWIPPFGNAQTCHIPLLDIYPAELTTIPVGKKNVSLRLTMITPEFEFSCKRDVRQRGVRKTGCGERR